MTLSRSLQNLLSMAMTWPLPAQCGDDSQPLPAGPPLCGMTLGHSLQNLLSVAMTWLLPAEPPQCGNDLAAPC